MLRIIKIGLDVHSTTYSICVVEPRIGEKDNILAATTVPADYKYILMFTENLKSKLGFDDDYDIVYGYEAGCLGYSLYNQLTEAGAKCVILAPTTMLTQKGVTIKTDPRDAKTCALCLANGTYNSVYIPTQDDDSVKEYIRMRDDHKLALKKIKQQANALCLRHGYHYDGTRWTQKHLVWIKKLELAPLYRETLDEYLATYSELIAKIERYDARIEEITAQDRYREKVKKLRCFLGIETHTALSLIVETGDFKRFAKGNIYAHFLGLAPGERSSGVHINRIGITKAGNNHLRTLLVEAAMGICRGTIGHKSKALRSKQQGCSAEIIAYADKANTRLRSRYYRLIRHGKKRNVAVAAIARELACFVWGMMTDNIGLKVS